MSQGVLDDGTDCLFSMEPLFHHGVPSSESLEVMLRQIDQHLHDNSKQLEQCMSEIMQTVTDMPGGAGDYATPMEAVEMMEENRLLEQSACDDPDLDDVTRLLRHVIRTLEKQPGCEEHLLQALFKLSSQDGVLLPMKDFRSSPMTDSLFSLNMVTDGVEQVHEALWQEICVRFRRYFLDRLNELPTSPPQNSIHVTGDKRLPYVRSLCSLFPAEDVWPRYRSLRVQQMDIYMNSHLTNEQGESLDFVVMAKNFQQIADLTIAKIDEDFEVLNSGVFTKVVMASQAIHEIYLDKLLDEVSIMMDDLQEELTKVGRRDLQRSQTGNKLSQFKSSLKKNVSRSLDNLVHHLDDAFTDLAFPNEYFVATVELILSLIKVEEHVNNLFRAMTWEVTGSNTKINNKSNLRGVLKTNQSDSSILSSSGTFLSDTGGSLYQGDSDSSVGVTPIILSENEQAVNGSARQNDRASQWDWRLVFKKLIPDLARSVERSIQETCQGALARPEAMLQTTSVRAELVGGRLDYPKVISKSVYDVMDKLDSLLPLARVGNDAIFSSVRSSFIDTTLLQVKEFIIRINKLSNGLPREHSLQQVYVALSSAAFIRNQLLHYDGILVEDNSEKKPFGVLYREFCDMVDALSRHLVEHHNSLLSTSLLHDAESHHWQDSKMFFENERCSLSVQMWSLYMQGLCHDLWSYCPPKLAQSIYTAVLQESLSTFAQRYTAIKPSYNRTQQFRNDILTILLCTSELLLSACPGISQYLDVSLSNPQFYGIHNNCCSLLAAMAVVSSPIEHLYKVFKRGFTSRRLREGEKDERVKGHANQWLSWIRPDMFKVNERTFSDIQTSTAVYLQVKLLSHQPDPNLVMLLQALLMKDYTLSILLLIQASNCQAGLASHSQTVCHPSETQSSASLPNTSKQASHYHIIQPIIEVLIRCYDFPDVIAKVLLPVLNRSDRIDIFDERHIIGKDVQFPHWLATLCQVMMPMFNRVIAAGARVLLAPPPSHVSLEPFTSGLKELPCGCEPVVDYSSRPQQSTKEVILTALSSLVSELVASMYTLPSTVCVFFSVAQKALADKGIRTTRGCFGLQVIAAWLRFCLLDIKNIEKQSGIQSLDETTKENLVMFAECVYHVLTTQSVGKSSGLPRLASSFIRSKRDWLRTQMNSVTHHLNNETYSCAETNILEGATVDFVEYSLTALVSSLLDSPNGERNLLKLYNLVMHNVSWLAAQWDVPALIPHSEPQHIPAFISSMGPIRSHQFSPLKSYDKIHNVTIDHERISEIGVAWEPLLQSDLGLTEIGFRTLLFHRHEMQDGAQLEDNEKKPVQGLRAKYDVEQANLT